MVIIVKEINGDIHNLLPVEVLAARHRGRHAHDLKPLWYIGESAKSRCKLESLNCESRGEPLSFVPFLAVTVCGGLVVDGSKPYQAPVYVTTRIF